MSKLSLRGVVALIAGWFTISAGWAGDKEELDKICAANTAAVQSIQTLYCKVRIDDPAGRFGISGGEYWRSGASERLRFFHRGNENWAVVRDGVVRNMVKQDVSGNPNMLAHPEVKAGLDGGRWHWHAAVTRHTGASPFLFNPWESALCSMSDGGKNGNVTFSEFAKNHRGELHSVVRPKDAPNIVVAEFRLPGYVCRQHLDRTANSMVRKTESRSEAPTGYSSSAEVTAFKEGAPGVFFPERVVVKRSQGGKDEPDEVFTFSDIALNKPIPAETFDLKYRPGLTLTDTIEGKSYKVDRDGKPIGEKVAVGLVVPPPLSPYEASPAAVTLEEPGPWGWWILPLAGAGFAVVVIAWLVMRVRSARV